MITVERIIGFAIRNPIVLDSLGEALRNDLVTANPLYRSCVIFADDFFNERHKMPLEGDWDLWISSLPEGRRDGIREAYSRLMGQDISGYDPGFFGEIVIEELRGVAARNTVSRLNASPDNISPEIIQSLAENVASIGTGSAQPVQEAWPTLATLLDRPELQQEPEELVPRLIWRGRHTLLAGLAKFGKSTIVTQGVAAATRAAPFLDAKTEYCRVVWCGVDEALGDTVRRLLSFEPRPDRVRLLIAPPTDLMGSLERVLDAEPTDLVVVDSLIEWTRRTVKEMPSDGDSAGWASVIRPLTALAHERDIGLLTIHHSRRSDGRYRSSGEIAAGVDWIYDMLGVRGNQSLRRFEGVGRWGAQRWIAGFEDGTYEFGGKAPEDLDRAHRAQELVPAIRAFVEGHPDCSKNAITRGVPGDNRAVEAALKLMESQEEVTIEQGGPGKASKVRLNRAETKVPGEEE